LEPSRQTTIFRPQLDFELSTLNVGDSESQHLDYCFHIGLIEHFAGVTGLRQTIRGRKRMPAIEFHVGGVGPINVEPGVQVEVDLGWKVETTSLSSKRKSDSPSILTSASYTIPIGCGAARSRIRGFAPGSFVQSPVTTVSVATPLGVIVFRDDSKYLSLELVRSETFVIEPTKKRLTVTELLQTHLGSQPPATHWNVPQADSFWRVAELPLLIAQGVDTSAKVAQHYEFEPRQSSYYRQRLNSSDLFERGSATTAMN